MYRIVAVVFALMVTGPAALAEVSLPSVFGDHMVLQRDVEVRIWGKAEPGEQVSVQLVPEADGVKEGNLSLATADQQGDWQVRFKALSVGPSWKMRIGGSKTKQDIEFKDVVFGEVWVASGQSNMAWTVSASANANEQIANSDNDQVRMWTAARTVSPEPADDVPGSWAVASPQTTGDFSAVAYYFARDLQEQLGVPVGVLHASWGGTPVEAWTSTDKLKSIDWAKPILDRYADALSKYGERMAEYQAGVKRWEHTRNGPANTGHKAGYAKPGLDDAKWETMQLPQAWEKAGLNKDGVVWFRRSIDLPDGWAGQALKLSLGPIDDGDTTYINNNEVGNTPPYIGNAWRRDRVYDVPKQLVKGKQLTIAVRVVDFAGAGGLWGKAEQMTLSRADGQGESVPLAGDWKYLHAHDMDPKNRPARPPAKPFGPDHPHSPAGLFNGMISPIVPYTIKGAIWYQGESNASRAQQYRKLFPAMIEDWRQRWGQGEFPFLFVQLANYRNPTDQVVDTDWAHLRDAQLHTLQTVKNTGMAVTIDIGDANDIHPRNKQDVGKRLARWALVDTYGKKEVVKSGPIYTPGSLKIEQGKAFIQFETFGSTIRSKGVSEPKPDTPLYGFTIAGKDGKFHVAQAESVTIEGKVVVWSEQVKEPVAVRYGWEDNPTEANLVNDQGLPASPFRTDDFKGPTDGRR